MWCLRGILDDGSFYGEVRFESSDPSRRRVVKVSGYLSPEDCERMAGLIATILERLPPAESGPHFGALFERLPPPNYGEIRLLYEYRAGEEARSPRARAFVELARLLERNFSPFDDEAP